jgi:hypothetical protein
MVERLHSIRGGPGSIPGWCSSIFGIWREVLRCNVWLAHPYYVQIIIIIIISHITSTYRYIMYFFRTFKKSTAPYKVHNMGLRYIKNLHSLLKILGSAYTEYMQNNLTVPLLLLDQSNKFSYQRYLTIKKYLIQNSHACVPRPIKCYHFQSTSFLIDQSL